MSDDSQFEGLWPGDRRWLAFDLCSETPEIRGMPELEQAAFRHQSDWSAHWFCDVGLPCISVLKNTQPFVLASNSGMAPFSPIREDTVAHFKEALATAARSGLSCGWYCGVDDILPIPNAAIDRVLPGAGYRSLVYGPEHSGSIPALVSMLESRGHEVWVVSDGVTDDVLPLVPATARLVAFTQLEAAYQQWREASFSA